MRYYNKHYNNLDDWNSRWGIRRAEFIASLISSHGKLLDIGGYKGDLKNFIPKSIDYHLIDLVKSEEKNLTIWNLNNTPLPYEDSSFDMIVAIDIFEHLERPKRLLEEIRRILKPDGYIILSLSTKRKRMHRHFLSEEFLNGFSIVRRDGIIFGIFPFLQKVPTFIASEIFYKVRK